MERYNMLVAKRRLSRFGGKWRRLIGSRKNGAELRAEGSSFRHRSYPRQRAHLAMHGRVVDQDVEFSKAVVAIKYS